LGNKRPIPQCLPQLQHKLTSFFLFNHYDPYSLTYSQTGILQKKALFPLLFPNMGTLSVILDQILF
jgi:hypothetical protein